MTRSALALLVLASGCGPAYEIQAVGIDLEPPGTVIASLAPDGTPVGLGDLSAAKGRVDIDVPGSKVVFSASGLPQIPIELQARGMRYRLWLRDLSMTPLYIGDLQVDAAGRSTRRDIYSPGGAPPLASVREAMVVLWYDASPAQIDPLFKQALTSDDPLGQRKDGHSGTRGKPGWVMDGVVVDTPATSPGASAPAHQH